MQGAGGPGYGTWQETPQAGHGPQHSGGYGPMVNQQAAYQITQAPVQQQGAYQITQAPVQQQGAYQITQAPVQQQGAYQITQAPVQQQYTYQEKVPGGLPPQNQQMSYSSVSTPQAYTYPGNQQGAYQVEYSAEKSGAEPIQQYMGEMPDDDDVDENLDVPEPTPSAPPLEKMDKIGGYSNVGFNMALPPPSYEEVMQQDAEGRQESSKEPVLTEEEAREALLTFVNDHCCYGKGAAEKLHFTHLISTSAFHYTLETFSECRQISWGFLPFTGQYIDGPMNGRAPEPWDIPASPQCLFTDSMIEIEVPHTASVKPCHNCQASGVVRCHKCKGRGKVRCGHCFGRGHKTVHRQGKSRRQTCHFCHGSGRRRCSKCSGSGTLVCPACAGYKQLKCYIKLTIFWKNHIADHIVERTPLPNTLVRTVSGVTVLQETQPKVLPISHFQDEEVNVFSAKLVSEQVFPLEKVLQQRQTVRMVPVTQCLFKWKDKDLDYFVYGLEHKVYAPDYPQQCCCGCSIL